MSQEKREIVDSNWDRIHKTHYAAGSTNIVSSSYIDDPRAKLTASYSNGSRIRMIAGEIFETNDGTYQIIYQNGPLSCSVAGGMTLLITFPNGISENVFFPPGYNCKRIEDRPEKQPSQYVPSSGFTEETLKEAIEDAKQVRKKALENAKEALEEAFDFHPKLNTIKQKVDNNQKSDPEEDAILRRPPVAGRNAFEIRTDILQLSMDYAIYSKSHLSPDEVLNIAKKFYAFVENKR